MSWLQVELKASPETLQAIEDALVACGAVSITLVSDADEPVLEPAPGETPLWRIVRVQALFDLDTDMARLRQTLVALDLVDADLQVDFVQPEDWQEAVRSHAVEQVFSGRLWLLPKDAPANTDNDLVQLRLDPGLAFGSGGHATTRMCLQWLAEHVGAGARVLDFGCGSGILAIAAALLGARVVAVDYDPQAVMAARDNAAYNGLDESTVQVLSLEEWHASEHLHSFDVVVANILAGPLKELAGEFEQVAVAGGAIVLSGVLEEQAQEVMASYNHTRFTTPLTEGGWVCLHGEIC